MTLGFSNMGHDALKKSSSGDLVRFVWSSVTPKRDQERNWWPYVEIALEEFCSQRKQRGTPSRGEPVGLKYQPHTTVAAVAWSKL